MNPNNYASLEASKRLVETGIVIETEAIFVISGDLSYIAYKDRIITSCITIPAPSMAEVWRELPDRFNNRPICVSKTSNQWTHAEILGGGPSFLRLNPTDALIDLLIHIKGVDTHK